MSDIPTIDPALLTDADRMTELYEVIQGIYSQAGNDDLTVAAAVQAAARRAVAEAVNGAGHPSTNEIAIRMAIHVAERRVDSLISILRTLAEIKARP